MILDYPASTGPERLPGTGGSIGIAGARARVRTRRQGRDRRIRTIRRLRTELVATIVEDYDPAIEFFVDILGFELIEDSAASTNDGRPKRRAVVRPPKADTGILLARADGQRQKPGIAHQVAGRVGFFVRVGGFDKTYARMIANDVTFVTEPRHEPYGRVVVFLDIAGNRWDLLGPRSRNGSRAATTHPTTIRDPPLRVSSVAGSRLRED